ncbi:27670_t:CDS:1, partial [Racocetra persica]
SVLKKNDHNISIYCQKSADIGDTNEICLIESCYKKEIGARK